MTPVIDSDLLEGLPAAGSNIGGAMKGVAPGAGALIFTTGVASSLSTIPKAIAKGINKKGKSKNKKAKLKLHHKAYRYGPIIHKMGPY